jgi:hypothetical protein
MMDDALTDRLEAANDMANLIEGLARFLVTPGTRSLTEIIERVASLEQAADAYWTATEKDGMA